MSNPDFRRFRAAAVEMVGDFGTLAKCAKAHGMAVYSPFAEARDALIKLDQSLGEIAQLPEATVAQIVAAADEGKEGA